MAIAQVLSLLVLAIAMAVGVIGKVKPELFLQLPNGFIPWALTGNRMPPFFDESCLYEEHWTGQNGDIVMSTGAKAGSIWMQTIVMLLRSNGWDGFDPLKDYFDTCEMLDYPQDTLEKRLEKAQQKRSMVQAKGLQGHQYFTHKFPSQGSKLFGVDPERNPQIKYIAMVRNGKEVLRSILPFLNAHRDQFRKMWGGFPPKMGGPGDIVKFAVDDMPDFYFGHLLSWWVRKDQPNVLLLHYRNLREDPVSTIKQVAEFLEIPLTEQLLAQVLHKSSLEYMSHPSRTTKYTGFHGPPNNRFTVVEDGAHIRKGGGKLEGDTDEFLTEELSKKWEAAIQKHFGHDPALIKFANTGAQ